MVDQRWTKGTTATSPVMDRYGYTYDRNSNRLTRSNALAAAFSETYAYDALNQLQSFNRTGGTTTSQQWQFDALGNWTTVTTNGVAQARTANAQNELTQVGSSSLAYSTTGNLTTDAEGRTLAYDAWNRLVSVKNAAGTEVARYEYDGLNRRIVEQVGTLASPAAAIRDVYYSQDWQALEERVRTSPSQVAATADARFIWSPVYVDAMVARDRNADGNATTGTGGLEQRVYALQDANWNTTAIIAATGVPGVSAGAVINRFAYTPYGEVQTLTASWTTPPAGSKPAVPWSHLFQGLEFTEATGLAYVRHRDYSATLGRFIELDPIGFSAGDNNWYRFVANGPTGKTDPSGLEGMVFAGGSGNQSRPDVSDGYAPWRDPLTGGESCIGRLRKIPTPARDYDWHYDRNRFNHAPLLEKDAIAQGWELLKPEISIYHRHGIGGSNKKYLSPDGAMEGVYDHRGKLVTSPDNAGTYNYGDGRGDFQHVTDDMFPYWIHGNCPDDPTPFPDRVFGPGTTPTLPKPPSDRDLEDIIEAIIGQPVFPRF